MNVPGKGHPSEVGDVQRMALDRIVTEMAPHEVVLTAHIHKATTDDTALRTG